jgi:hypothetical protein
MTFKLGDAVLEIGKCHEAQARILVSKELATWEDGKIRVILRKAQTDAFFNNNPNLLRDPVLDKNISEPELERRLDWFKNVILKTTLAVGELHRPGQDINEEEKTRWLRQKEDLKYISENEAEGVELTEEEIQGYFDDKNFVEIDPILVNVPSPSILDLTGGFTRGGIVPETEILFDSEMEKPGVLLTVDEIGKENEIVKMKSDELSDLSGLWESAPDLNSHFGEPEVTKVLPPILDADQERILKEVMETQKNVGNILGFCGDQEGEKEPSEYVGPGIETANSEPSRKERLLKEQESVSEVVSKGFLTPNPLRPRNA